MGWAEDVVVWLADAAAGAAWWEQFGVLFLAGAIPFVESYLGSFFGVLVGVDPFVAVTAAVVGNLVSTFVVIAVASRTRGALRSRRAARTAADDPVPANVAEPGVAGTGPAERGPDGGSAPDRPKRYRKVGKYLDRFGVPGVSLLGPIVLASQLTAPALIGLGASTAKVYAWMGVSIVAWGVLFGFFGEFAITLLQ